MTRPLLFVAALLAAPPAVAQSFEDAVAANVTLALQLCLAPGGPAATVAAFQRAGFAYSTRGTPGFETWHVFAAPAGTARAEVYEGQTAPSCEVFTDHIAPAAAAPFVGQVLNQVAPGRFRQDPPSGYGCASFSDNAPAIPFVVAVGAADDSQGCPAAGPTRISTFSAV
jgi:hypothetical protein